MCLPSSPHAPHSPPAPHNSKTTGQIAETQTVLESAHRGEGPMPFSIFFVVVCTLVPHAPNKSKTNRSILEAHRGEGPMHFLYIFFVNFGCWQCIYKYKNPDYTRR
jgi:hypothetical protein